MDNTKDSLVSIFTPCGDDLALLLSQPEITGAFIRKLLARRGVIVKSNEKNVLNDHLILSFLSAKEVGQLLDEIRNKEDSLKLRSTIHEVETVQASLNELVPRQADLKFNGVCSDPNGNYFIDGDPGFSKYDDNRYVLEYTLIRNHLSSNWIKSRSRVDGRIELKKEPGSNYLIIEGYHSSLETKMVNSKFKSEIKENLEKRNLIKKNSDKSLLFGDFSNEQRIAFFMKFTESFPKELFTFKKIGDLDFRVDDKLVPEEEVRISWMKNDVSKSKISGQSIQNAFLLTERPCWKYIKVWRVEMKFSLSTVDYEGYFILILEFDGYSRSFADSSKFQLSIDRIVCREDDSSSRKEQTKILAKLNDYAFRYAESILGH